MCVCVKNDCRRARDFLECDGEVVLLVVVYDGLVWAELVLCHRKRIGEGAVVIVDRFYVDIGIVGPLCTFFAGAFVDTVVVDE